MTTKIENKDKDKIIDDERITKAGIPKDWVPPPMQISTDIKFCDMSVEMK